MSEVKNLLEQIKQFTQTEALQNLDDVFGKLVGNEISSRLEQAKNADFARFLRKEMAASQEMSSVNGYLIAVLCYGEKKLSAQRISDFNAALEDVIREKMLESQEFAEVISHIKQLVESPLDFAGELLSLEEETLLLEEKLSRYASMPCFNEVASVNGINEFAALCEVIDAEYVVSPDKDAADSSHSTAAPVCLRIVTGTGAQKLPSEF